VKVDGEFQEEKVAQTGFFPQKLEQRETAGSYYSKRAFQEIVEEGVKQ